MNSAGEDRGAFVGTVMKIYVKKGGEYLDRLIGCLIPRVCSSGVRYFYVLYGSRCRFYALMR